MEKKPNVQMNFQVPKDMKVKFHKKCLDQGLTMHEVLNAFIEQFVNGMLEFE
jgi:hypothetical protein